MSIGTGLIKEEILELLHMKQEGSYWDFKESWHSKKPDLLHDIICMANNLAFRNAYIVMGITDDYRICGIDTDTNRQNTQNLVDFLRSKKFAGGVRPTVKVDTIRLASDDNLQYVDIDIVTIISDRNTPYYLTEQYKDSDGLLYANNIYTRVQDTNTPKIGSADLHHIELLWKKRFGIEMPIKDKYLALLDQPQEWEHDFGNKDYAYHRTFPEFRIKVIKDSWSEGWEPQAAFFQRPEMRVAPMHLMYHNTIIKELELVSLDDYTLYTPWGKPCTIQGVRIAELNNPYGLRYHYYCNDDFAGKLARVLLGQSMDFHIPFSSCVENNVNLFLIFNNEQERNEYHLFALENYSKINVSEVKEIYRYFLGNQNNSTHYFDEYHVLALLLASELYNAWLESKEG